MTDQLKPDSTLPRLSTASQEAKKAHEEAASCRRRAEKGFVAGNRGKAKTLSRFARALELYAVAVESGAYPWGPEYWGEKRIIGKLG